MANVTRRTDSIETKQPEPRSGGLFVPLLVALIGLFVIAPMLGLLDIGEGARLLSFLTVAVYSVMLLVAVAVIAKSRIKLIVALGLALPTVLVQLSTQLSERPELQIIGSVFAMAFLGFVIYEIMKYLFVGTRVTVNTIAASLCAYLLLGVWFSSAYLFIEAIAPGSFAMPNEPDMAIRGDFGTVSLYFSMVTLTTLGYGDVIPMHGPVRALASVQAVIGQIYLTVLVARLVGLHIAEGSRAARDADQTGSR